MSTNSTLPCIEWRIRVAMAERNVKTVTELNRRLDRLGVKISNTQLNRIVDGGQRISADVLAGIAVVLDCEIGDLMRLSRGMHRGAANDPQK
ncbi:hypothetical protein B1757_13115 [Acidithiobacillus marinus]|uniref:HTH cro/C1-type domain-containing protein n=1 Tax=Acidithiobacillus marinus TaxID=187490 RepID=A0A2I1DIT1_9PROT|nr:helix-turn-helix transcriptional regulator [Acidithiobacillus marinus]PKY09780.1 hypothetical protein B1757_13115 [Acidithiobacillus marinus]